MLISPLVFLRKRFHNRFRNDKPGRKSGTIGQKNHAKRLQETLQSLANTNSNVYSFLIKKRIVHTRWPVPAISRSFIFLYCPSGSGLT